MSVGPQHIPECLHISIPGVISSAAQFDGGACQESLFDNGRVAIRGKKINVFDKVVATGHNVCPGYGGVTEMGVVDRRSQEVPLLSLRHYVNFNVLLERGEETQRGPLFSIFLSPHAAALTAKLWTHLEVFLDFHSPKQMRLWAA